MDQHGQAPGGDEQQAQDQSQATRIDEQDGSKDARGPERLRRRTTRSAAIDTLGSSEIDAYGGVQRKIQSTELQSSQISNRVAAAGTVVANDTIHYSKPRRRCTASGYGNWYVKRDDG
eukprot:CAMPEP_0119316312 /NCGR_PEP_ID=MMETSP1333-20130426/39399_1 /TAXON_ID=418940 /ORGANISM="Scyphosphaera apsteinii, Strain RCC1455" /LENGTH=117 /DNA_ID=CAMNT_0007321927 /DNA_START=151 /DNA_END=504 /DNA_ORIENTATION=-